MTISSIYCWRMLATRYIYEDVNNNLYDLEHVNDQTPSAEMFIYSHSLVLWVHI